jgi:copper chaperone
MTTRTYAVAGMTCAHCVGAVSDEVSKIAGVADVAVDLADGTVSVTGDGFDDTAIRAAIDEAGYQVVG